MTDRGWTTYEDRKAKHEAEVIKQLTFIDEHLSNIKNALEYILSLLVFLSVAMILSTLVIASKL